MNWMQKVLMISFERLESNLYKQRQITRACIFCMIYSTNNVCDFLNIPLCLIVGASCSFETFSPFIISLWPLIVSKWIDTFMTNSPNLLSTNINWYLDLELILWDDEIPICTYLCYLVMTFLFAFYSSLIAFSEDVKRRITTSARARLICWRSSKAYG